MDEVHDAIPRSGTCPTCGLIDRVENVAVARERAVESVRVFSPLPAPLPDPNTPGAVPGAPAFPARRRSGSVTRPTTLGRRLSPVPLGSAGPLVARGVVLGVFGAATLEMRRATLQDGDDRSMVSLFLLMGLAFAAVGVGFLLLGAAVQIRRRPVRRGRAKAEEVSRLGWYCGRCGSVYFRAGAVPDGAQDSKSYSLDEFRRIVFGAGGYPHLANVRSVR